MLRIDTPEQFLQQRAQLKPEFITSARHGHIPVPMPLLVKPALLRANNYNPNSVSKDKMKLLAQSIRDNGFCFPIVTIWDDDEQCFVIVDGFHRSSMAGDKWLDLDYVPVVFVEHNISKRMYATIQFNKARGVHQVDLDADVVRALIEQGETDEQIAIHLGIDIDTVHRYKQLTGIAELFKNQPWSSSWTMDGPEGSDATEPVALQADAAEAKWEYGGAYRHHDMTGDIHLPTDSIVKVCDITQELPEFMKQADTLFVDPPCSQGNLRTFHTKAGQDLLYKFDDFEDALFQRIDEIQPDTLFLEVFKSNRERFMDRVRQRYIHVHEYNSCYYNKPGNQCWIIQASKSPFMPYPIEGMDEEKIIAYICEHHPYDVIGDLCMGRGLVGRYAFKNGKKFVGTELNKKRLAVLVDHIKSSIHNRKETSNA